MSAIAFDLLILDCDGVVVDSEPIAARVLAEMIGELGVPMTTQEAIERFVGQTFETTLHGVATQLGAPLPRAFAVAYRERSFAALADEVSVMPGLLAALDLITIPCCIASNGPHAKLRITLGATGLLARFNGRIHSAAEVARGKPFPELFLHAARQHGAEPARCLVIEDSASGIAAARAAGMTVLGFCAAAPARRLLEAGAHRCFTHMHELPALVAAGA